MSIDHAVLERVRKLLALAQHPNTPKPEAEQAEARALKMIADHAIDQALLAEAGTVKRGEPIIRTVNVEAPYERPKQVLISMIGAAFDTKVILSGDKGTLLVGFESDLDAVEALFTTLLMHATTDMNRHEPPYFADGAKRFSWRRSFMLGFAQRIGERLQEQKRVAVEEHRPGTDIVLRDRALDVQRKVEEEFPRLRKSKASIGDRRGAAHGRASGDRASLGGTAVGGRRTAIGG